MLVQISTVLVWVGGTVIKAILWVVVCMITFYWLAEILTVSGVSKPSLSDLQGIVKVICFIATASFWYIAVSIYAPTVEGQHAIKARIVRGFDLNRQGLIRLDCLLDDLGIPNRT